MHPKAWRQISKNELSLVITQFENSRGGYQLIVILILANSLILFKLLSLTSSFLLSKHRLFVLIQGSNMISIH